MGFNSGFYGLNTTCCIQNNNNINNNNNNTVCQIQVSGQFNICMFPILPARKFWLPSVGRSILLVMWFEFRRRENFGFATKYIECAC